MRTLFPVAAGLFLAAYPASAQSAGLADILAANANCESVADARASLERNLAQASPDTSQDAIISALREVAGRDGLCTELKAAAGDFADQALAESVTATDEAVSSASTSIVAATLAEAERRAANLKFEVAPPPRFMTKERNSRP
ncbi:MAG TPA: hypothetical protein VIA80_03695 [Hyphomonadaceae bacterium]